MNISKIQFFSFLVYLLPIALISGPLIPELIVLSCNIFFLIKIYQEKKFNYFHNLFFKLFLIFWIFINFSSIFSENMLYSLKYSVSYIRYAIFVLSINYLIKNNNFFINNFYKFLIITIIILVIDSYFQFFFGFNLFGFEKPSPYMITSFFNDEWILGTYLMRLSPLLIALFLYLNKNQTYKFNSYLFYLAIIFPLIFLSGQRTPFYLSIFFLISSLIILNLDRYKVLSLLFAIAIISTNILVDKKKYDGIGTGYKSRMISDIVYNYNKIPKNQKDQISQNNYLKYIFISPGHNNLWFTAIKIYQENKIFGTGPNSFRVKCKDHIDDKRYVCSTHPHSYVFQLLAETGLISLLTYFGIYFYILTILVLYYFKQNILKINLYLQPQMFLFLSILINFAPLVPSGNFFNNHQNILIFLPIAFLLNFLETSRDETND